MPGTTDTQATLQTASRESLQAHWQQALASFRAVLSDYTTDRGGDDVQLTSSVQALSEAFVQLHENLEGEAPTPSEEGHVTIPAVTDENATAEVIVRHFATIQRAMHVLAPGSFPTDYDGEEDAMPSFGQGPGLSMERAEVIGVDDPVEEGSGFEAVRRARERAVQETLEACNELEQMLRSLQSRAPPRIAVTTGNAAQENGEGNGRSQEDRHVGTI